MRELMDLVTARGGEGARGGEEDHDRERRGLSDFKISAWVPLRMGVAGPA